MFGSAPTTRLVGRDAELAILDSALERARASEPSVTLVLGEYGIGKTRLMRELEIRAARQGVLVLAGECVPLEDGELPYGPIGAGLRSLPPDAVAAAFEPLPAGARAQLADAFPQLPAPGEPSPPRSSGVFQQGRFYEFLLGLLQRLAEAAPLLMIIEDFQAADGATHDFLRFLLRNFRDQRIALVLTYRKEDLAPADRAAIEDLSTRARSIELTGLDGAALQTLIADRLDHPPTGRLVSEIAARSAGNPFFAQELLAARMASRTGALPASLTDALLTRMRRLSQDGQRVVLMAAAMARPVDCEVLGEAASLREPELSRAVREAIDCNVLERLAPADAFQLRHEVVRQVIYDDLLPGERADLHACLAATLTELGAALGSGELAHHWRAAGRTAEAIAASLEAARATADAHAFAEALGHFDRALELADAAGGLPAAVSLDRAEVLHRAAETARYAGDNERAATLVQRALEHVDSAAEPLRAARLHELWGHCQSFEYATALHAFRTAKALLPSTRDVDRARLLGAEAHALIGVGTWEALREGRRQADAALALAVAARARPEEAHARIILGLGMAVLGESTEGVQHLRRARALAIELGRPEDLLRAELYLGEALRLAGDFAGALSLMDEGRAHAAEHGMEAFFGRFMAFNGAEDLFVLGRWAETQRRLEAAAVDRDPPSWNRLLHALVAGQLALGRGDADGARAPLAVAREVFDAGGRPPEYAAPVHAALAELALTQRDYETARRLVETGRAIVAGQADLLYAPALFSIGARVEADAADAGRVPRTQAAERAGVLCDELAAMLPVADGTEPPPSALAHLALCRAELARAVGADAVESWAEAVTAWDAVGAPYPAAYACLHQAEAVLLEGQRERTVAAELLSRAYETARELGAGQLQTQAELLAGRDAVYLRSRGGRNADATGKPVRDFDLTAREREVLALLAAGLTNRAIAKQLVISEKTADSHVTRILRKLDVHDRRVAATRAYQLGLVSP